MAADAIDGTIILRRWAGRIRTADAATYLAYVSRTGAMDYASTPGNIGFQIATRDLGDGTTELTTLSWWRSMDSIRLFAGEDVERARYYPEDDRFLIERPEFVEHHVVTSSRLQWPGPRAE
ncbi:antibiotic biosynthesis monooxygenase [Sphingomonas sp. DBB INV C78]|uniref:hypothetical protein n=1 Tax=Sphingomonas sp. DBB INV C78 TaxID=3349434 RepID=UPI0036D355D2